MFFNSRSLLTVRFKQARLHENTPVRIMPPLLTEGRSAEPDHENENNVNTSLKQQNDTEFKCIKASAKGLRTSNPIRKLVERIKPSSCGKPLITLSLGKLVWRLILTHLPMMVTQTLLLPSLFGRRPMRLRSARAPSADADCGEPSTAGGAQRLQPLCRHA